MSIVTELSIDGQRFKILGTQRGGAHVYRGNAGAYLRLGTRETIERDLALHRAMERAKFPVAPIISDGELGSDRYFAEKSLGNRSFRAIFEEDMYAGSDITKAHFDALTSIVKKLFVAQVRAGEDAWDVEEFAEGIKLPTLCKEIPNYADALRARFATACKRFRDLPGTLTHGDCNPANLYEGGIIDLEDSFHGPLGYDVVSAVTTIEWSPRTREHEFYAQYRISDEQRQQFFRVFDVVAHKMHISPISRYVDDFSFCRAVWLCSGMHPWPRLQQWRFEKLIQQYFHE